MQGHDWKRMNLERTVSVHGGHPIVYVFIALSWHTGFNSMEDTENGDGDLEPEGSESVYQQQRRKKYNHRP
jgi:hypothetical protein